MNIPRSKSYLYPKYLTMYTYTEEENGEAETSGAAGEARCPSGEGSDADEPLEDSDESEEAAPSAPDLLPLLSHALRRLHQLQQPPDD